MSGLNVVALISGGKDSFFSILHCQANGHKVVALANLHPSNPETDDLDSHMYQTVGHAVIPLYEKALGLPLYRHPITGSAKYSHRDYAAQDAGDETESLLPLLRKVLAGNPEVNAVSTGAIMSDYQRTRVDSIALRLGLIPLSYLWQWPSLPPNSPTSLLDDMATVGQDSRIVKVASGGLDDTFLWQNVADARIISRLSTATRRFGSPGDGAVLGEGGEFETLAVSGPGPLWKGRISVSPDNVKIVPGEAGSATVQVSDAAVVPLGTDDAIASVCKPRIPDLLDASFELISKDVLAQCNSDATPEASTQRPLAIDDEESFSSSSKDMLFDVIAEGDTAAIQTLSIMKEIESWLDSTGHTFGDLVYCVITLRNMADFTAVNPVYGSFFPAPNPPARVTISCADVLPMGAQLSISVVRGLGSRAGLHVQSRSYWAPANIGPYSQAIKVTTEHTDTTSSRQLYVAGQIPLLPASMQLPAATKDPLADFIQQSILALQHMHRISLVMKADAWTFGIAFLASLGRDPDTLTQHAVIARKTWAAYHKHPVPQEVGEEDEDQDFDVWHLSHRAAKPWLTGMAAAPPKLEQRGNTSVPPLVVVAADGLPRDAHIEWVGFADSSVHSWSAASTIPPHLQGLLRNFRNRIWDA